MSKEHWGVSERRILSMIADGSLPAFKISPRMYRIRGEDVDAYVAKKEVEAETPRDLSASRVYFIGCDRYVKIGIALDLMKRLRALQAANPLPLEILATEPGHIQRERELHKRFKHLHHQTEWFRHEGDLAHYIEWLRK